MILFTLHYIVNRVLEDFMVFTRVISNYNPRCPCAPWALRQSFGKRRHRSVIKITAWAQKHSWNSWPVSTDPWAIQKCRLRVCHIKEKLSSLKQSSFKMDCGNGGETVSWPEKENWIFNCFYETKYKPLISEKEPSGSLSALSSKVSISDGTEGQTCYMERTPDTFRIENIFGW